MYAADERICMKILPRVEDYAVDSASKFQFHQPIRSRVMKFQSWSVQILFQSDVHVQISCEPTIHRGVLKLTTQLAEMAGYTLKVERLFQINYIIRNELKRPRLEFVT